jgi:pyruvate dehydrogenase E2 component (dihydrolipoamide acetyltransferase)
MAEVILMPKLGFDMAEGKLVRWVKSEGEPITKGEVLAEIETDKATVEVESGFSGVIRRQLVEQGMILPVNDPIAVIGEPDEDINQLIASLSKGEAQIKTENSSTIGAEEGALPVTSDANKESGLNDKGMQKISPLARRLAAEKGVEINKLHGSGPGGRIVRRDVDLVEMGSLLIQKTASIPGEKKLTMSKLRQAIGRRMTESKQQIPHFYVTRLFKVERLLDLRKQFNASLPESEKLSVNDFIIKATALALGEFPNLNASFKGNAILMNENVNIGIAVSVEGGLLTVVCRDAAQKPLRQISLEARQMAERARSGKVKPEDIEGSTFSISNLGMFEVDEFIAIINPPEAAILALGAAQEVAVVESGMVKPGWRMKGTISVDHRISDGAEAARFMQTLAKYIEEPVRLMI